MKKDLNYYMSLPYKIVIESDEEDGGFVASCPELRGCVTCAETQIDALRMLEDAKEAWLQACIEDQIEIPEPIRLNDYSGQFKLRIPKSLHKKLVAQALEEGVSMNHYCVYLLSKGVGI